MVLFKIQARSKGGGIGGQIPLSMEKFLHFARVFEKKYQKSPPLNFSIQNF